MNGIEWIVANAPKKPWRRPGHPGNRLTAEVKLKIASRLRAGHLRREIAQEFGVNRQTVDRIAAVTRGIES